MEKTQELKFERRLLANWKAKLALLGAITAPITAYYSTMAAVQEKINKVELKGAETYAPRSEVSDIKKDIGEIKGSIGEVKGMLQTIHRYQKKASE